MAPDVVSPQNAGPAPPQPSTVVSPVAPMAPSAPLIPQTSSFTPFQPQFGSLPVQDSFAPQNSFPPGYLGGSFFPGPITQPGPTIPSNSAFGRVSHLAPPPPQYNSLSRGFTMPPLAHDAVLPPHPRRAQREEDNRRNSNTNDRRSAADSNIVSSTRSDRNATAGPAPRRDRYTDDSAPYEYRRELNPDVRGRGIRGSTYAPRSRHDGGRGRNDNFRGRGPPPNRSDVRSSSGPSNRPQQARAHQRDEYDHFLGDDDGAKLYSPRRHPKYRYDSWIPAIVEGRFVPNPSAAETTPRGYPILPPVPAEPGDDSEYPSEESDSDDKRQEKKKAAMIKERNRQAAAVAQLAPGSIVPPAYPTPAPPSAGMFGRLSFDQIDDARVLLNWWAAGDASAYYMAVHLITYYAENTAASRPPGIVHIMSNQSTAGSDFVYARTGQNTSLAKLRAAASNTVTRSDRRRMGRHRNSSRHDHSTTTTGTSTGPSSVIDHDEVMPPAPELSLASFQPSFLGTSPPTVNLPDAPAGLGPSASLADALEYMGRLPPSRWTPGIRLHDGTWPTSSTPIRTDPLVDDVQAARFILMIAPPESEGREGGRDAFIELAMIGFSLFGLFERFVQRGQWMGDSLPLEHYPFDARTLNLSLVLSWIHQHGISPGTEGARALHSFAASWRNQRENLASPTGVQFSSEPINERSVMSWPDEAITSWSHLQHGQLRAGVQSDYPRTPRSRAPSTAAPVVTVPPTNNDEGNAGPTDESAGPTEPVMEVDEEAEPGELPRNDENAAPPSNDEEQEH
ncbi:hypothetical protein R3P38DRAFT_3191088 [Favolaschia claudopus]|uniref:Uncharacterized protein n=1 Tax=Favolaschia claudopus TaxID=2862362 RepID=A0AAW0BPN0_9AGAR